MQLLKLSTVEPNSRVQIYDDRFTFFLFWISKGSEPIVFIDPNITELAIKLINGEETEVGTIALNGNARPIQFSDTNPQHTVNIDGNGLVVTMQRRTPIGASDMEIELLVDDELSN